MNARLRNLNARQALIAMAGGRIETVEELPPVESKICANPNCGKRFIPNSPRQKYCCKECKDEVKKLKAKERETGTK